MRMKSPKDARPDFLLVETVLATFDMTALQSGSR
jgi:hypothetical protein